MTDDRSAGRSGPLRPRLPRGAAVAGVVALATLVLLAVSVTIRGGVPFAWDRAIIVALRRSGDLSQPVGPAWLRRFMLDVTALGDGTVLTGVVAIATGFLLVLRRYRAAALTVAATLSGSILAGQAKYWAGRPRPALVDHLVEVHGLSFPSGHATNSAIVCLTLAGLVAQVERGRGLRTYTLAVAAVLVALIGTSRVYLGVHWPSDVLAGWCAGTLWALLWWMIGARLRGSRIAG